MLVFLIKIVLVSILAIQIRSGRHSVLIPKVSRKVFPIARTSLHLRALLKPLNRYDLLCRLAGLCSIRALAAGSFPLASVVKLGMVLEFLFGPGPLVEAGMPAEISVRCLIGWVKLHAFFDLLSLLVLEIYQTFHLPHAFSFLSSVLLPFLIPSPLVDLCFRQSSLDRQH